MSADLRIRPAVDDAELTALHARAFGNEPGPVQAWGQRLARHSVSWVGVYEGGRLIGFVNACWDGGTHAFLLDTAVDPDHQRRGLGARLVRALVEDVRAMGCGWLHVDYEAHLHDFYTACGFRPTQAGLIDLG